MDKCNSLQTENVGLSEKLEVKTVTSEDEFRSKPYSTVHSIIIYKLEMTT